MKKIAYLIIGRSLRFEKTEKNKKKYDNKYKIWDFCRTTLKLFEKDRFLKNATTETARNLPLCVFKNLQKKDKKYKIRDFSSHHLEIIRKRSFFKKRDDWNHTQLTSLRFKKVTKKIKNKTKLTCLRRTTFVLSGRKWECILSKKNFGTSLRLKVEI